MILNLSVGIVKRATNYKEALWLQSRGTNVPNDFSIVGFDDLYLSQITTPRLTTVHQDIELKGEIVANSMIDFIEKKPIKSRSIILPISLVERDTVKKL